MRVTGWPRPVIWALMLGLAVGPLAGQEAPAPGAPATPETPANATPPAAEAAKPAPEPAGPPSVFHWPALVERQATMGNVAVLLMKQGHLDRASNLLEQLLREAIPGTEASLHYNLACAQAQQGLLPVAMISLRQAIQAGFTDQRHLRQDPDLAKLRPMPEFAKLLDLAAKPPPMTDATTFTQGALTLTLRTNDARRRVPYGPLGLGDGPWLVDEASTVYHAGSNLLLSVARFPLDHAKKTAPILTGEDAIAKLLRQWQSEGSAAGLWGLVYDNHDHDHSNLPDKYPQIYRTRYGEVPRKTNQSTGLQRHFLFLSDDPGPESPPLMVLGNSSTALTNGPFWRSNPRMSMLMAHGIQTAVAQYLANHLYFYPEHNDHDESNGDTYPANTPYYFISQGSSGSDQAFMQAILATIAALPPATQAALNRRGHLAPTLQMILRRCQKGIETPEDYLSPRAHPTVFDGQRLEVERMVRFAHALKPEQVPGPVPLAMIEEPQPRPGIDFFSHRPNQGLLGTPYAVARVLRATPRQQRFVVQAGKPQGEPGAAPAKLHWRLLRGDPDRIKFDPQDADGGKMAITVAWQERRPVWPESKISSNRVDIGVFAEQDGGFSAPSFVSFLLLAGEQREYDEQDRLVKVTYKSKPAGGPYTDPVLEAAKDWVDTYSYDPQGRLRGWTRKLADGQEAQLTAEGALVQERDALGRPARAQLLRYEERQDKNKDKAWPTLQMVPVNQFISYTYAGPDDLIGQAALSPPATPPAGAPAGP